MSNLRSYLSKPSTTCLEMYLPHGVLLDGEGRGGEGRGEEGRGGREGWREGGREGRKGRGGRERRDECYTYSNGTQYLNSSYVTYYVITCQSAFEYNNDVTYYVITCKSPFDWVNTEQWYVIITSDMTWTE